MVIPIQIFALALLFFGATATFSKPNSIMVSYDDGTTTLPPMENFEGTITSPPRDNFMDNSHNPNIIHLRYDKDTQAAMLARDPSYWVQRSLSWNTGGNDDNSTLDIDPPVNNDGQDRIIDGWYAFPGKLPIMAMLSISFDTGGYNCGGTIVTDQWILTAAHCILMNNSIVKSVMARVGTNSRDSGGQTVFASKGIGHPNFTPEYGTKPSGYDIAMLKLKKKLTFNSLVKKAHVGKLPNPSEGTVLTIAGWGITQSGSKSFALKHAQVAVKTCPCDNFGLPNFPSGSGSLVCSAKGSGQACTGDSGGFVGHTQFDTFVVVAVNSFGPRRVNGVCPPGNNGYTSTGFYFDWIVDTVNSN